MIALSRRDFLATSAFALAGLSACARNDDSTQATSSSNTTDTETSSEGTTYRYRIVDATEGAQLLLSNEEYLKFMTPINLDFRMQKKGATLDEWKAFATKQVLDITDKEKAALDRAMTRLQNLIEERGFHLPVFDEIIFAKTTMEEEGGAGAYTHGTQIYLGEALFEQMLAEDENAQTEVVAILAHELFHCLTRSDPSFRAEMYSILGFEVQDDDYAFGPSVAERIICNPDVERHNSSATFTIDGEKRRCAVVFYAGRPFEEPGDNFFDLGRTGLVPVDDLDTVHDSEEASDFWDVFGRNTDYVIDPEETMANNFSYAVTFGRDGMNYQSPEIIDAIFAKLSA